jgi:hypothetical protein
MEEEVDKVAGGVEGVGGAVMDLLGEKRIPCLKEVGRVGE